MIQKSRMLKTIIAMMITSMIMNSTIVSTVVAEDDSDPSGTESVVVADADVEQDETLKAEADANIQRSGVVVSMGDSFSAGEGIEPFYGTRASTGIAFEDWLAHRSQESWPGQLVVPGIGELRSSKYGNCDDPHWYFVAASGALISNVTNDQKKSYILDDMGDVHDDGNIERQDWILTELNSKNIVPDYITMTLGGNDVDFVDVIVTAAMNDAYKDPAAIDNKMEAVRKKLKDHVAKELFQTYQYINDTSSIGENKPCILVAGYPHLLNSDVSKIDWNAVILDGPVYQLGITRFDRYEAEEINRNIDLFNAVIELIVNKCRDDDRINLNIHFVDVTEAFRGFEAYTKDAMLNGILLPSLISDLDNRTFNENGFNPSAYSMHPNKRGAKDGYAKCVQAKIDELEGYKVAESVELIPTPTPLPDQESSVASESEPSVDASATALEVGSEITMGEYRGQPITWVVIDVKDDGALVLSKDVLEAKAFDENRNEATWEISSLRAWLNDEFYDTSFSAEDKTRIQKTLVLNPDNPISGADGGNDTEDYVFLLSQDEARQYFASDEERRTVARDYLTSDDIYIFDGYSPWWLRSPSDDTTGKYATKNSTQVTSDGYVDGYGEWITSPLVGVRPAMWITPDDSDNTPDNIPDISAGAFEIGSEITMGNYSGQDISWLVIDGDENSVLLISKEVLAMKAYDDPGNDVTWETCTLRSWLNNDFYNNAFSDEEKTKIIKSIIKNPGNPETGSVDKNDTEDYLFILTVGEAEHYFSTPDERKAEAAKYLNLNNPYAYWWLRTQDYSSHSAAFVFDSGDINPAGYGVDESSNIGVRPAMWVSADAVKSEKTEGSPTSVDEISYKIDPKLLGKWSFKERGQWCYVTFYDDNTCIFVEGDGEGKYIESKHIYSADGGKIWSVVDDEIRLMYYAQDGEKILIGDSPEELYITLTRVN